jgi:hypothetical protein
MSIRVGRKADEFDVSIASDCKYGIFRQNIPKNPKNSKNSI